MGHNIFVSRPSVIARKFERQYTVFEKYLKRRGCMPHRLGAGQFSLDAPLKAVMDLMRKCRGAIILGYPQYEIVSQINRAEKQEAGLGLKVPTPWNQIEGTIAFCRNIPVLVIAQHGIAGGIFDLGVTGEFVLNTNLASKDWHKKKEFQGIFQEWKNRIK